MDPNEFADRRRRRLLIAIPLGAILMVLVGVGVYGLLRGPDNATNPSVEKSGVAASTTDTSGPPSALSSAPQRLRDTDDAQEFASAVATGLFTWDTTSGYGPADYAQVIVDAGDPTGNESAGLATDVRSYLPTREAWAQLRTHQTRQWLTVDDVRVPDAWEIAKVQAAPGQLLPGTTAYTITGVRHRAGVWGAEPVTTRHEVAFTVFLTCQPSFEQCRVLRLSQLDNPLH